MHLIHLDPDLTDPTDVVRRLRFQPDGRRFAAVIGERGNVRCVTWWDVPLDKQANRFDPDDDEDEGWETLADPAVSPDLELVVRPAFDYEAGATARVTDTWANPPDDRFVGSAESVQEFTGFAFSADGSRLFVGLNSSLPDPFHVGWWDVDALFTAADPADAHLSSIRLLGPAVPTDLAVSASGRWLAVGTAGGEVRACDLVDGYEVRLVANPDAKRGRAVLDPLFSPDGRRLVARQGGRLAVWDAATWDRLGTIDGAITATAFHPSGTEMVTAHADGIVTVRDAFTWDEKRRFDWGVGPLFSVAYSPDGLTCAAGGGAGRVVVWDVDG